MSALRTCIAVTALIGTQIARGTDIELPETPKKPIVDTYHGLEVVDNYRWLEEKSLQARDWIEDQNRVTRARLDANPALAPLQARLKELMTFPSASYSRLQWPGPDAPGVFALKDQPPDEQPILVMLPSVDDRMFEKAIVDPTFGDSTGKTTIDFFAPSRDGRLVAVSLSKGGTEEGTLCIYALDTLDRLPDVIPRANYPTAGGGVAWNRDSSGFYYARLPRPGERPDADLNFYQQVYYHKLGTPTEQDTYVLGKEFPRIAEVFLDTSSDGQWLLVTVQNGDSGQFEHHVLGPDGVWKRLTHFTDPINAVAFGYGDDRALYMLSYEDAPRGKIIRLPLGETDRRQATTVVPESDAAIVGMRWLGNRMVASHVPTATGLYVMDIDGGPSQVRFFSRDGRPPVKLPLPPVSAVREMVHVGGDEVLLSIGTYTEPGAWYRYRPGDKRLHKTALVRKSPASFDDIKVERLFATSKDGTKVPMTVMYPKGLKLDGNNPALLYGYGGYGISLTPGLDVRRRVWFDHGGVYAIANIRGGGEYGRPWHQAAMRTGRQNGYDDFIACAKLLIDKGFTSPARLAIEGGSNGGLLMGVALTQHPELFRAVVAHVGIYDMLRSELSPNGEFNIPEFGTVKDPEQFKALSAYSPLHNVKDGVHYPAVMLLTGVNDGRVDPTNSYRMAARLQAATASQHPILLRTTFNAGHGLGQSLTEEIRQSADVYTFLFEQLGMENRRRAAPAQDQRK